MCLRSTLHATAGVAFIGMAPAFSANPAIVAGALFGDKMSPLSDTTGIAASIVGIDLFEQDAYRLPSAQIDPVSRQLRTAAG